MIGFKEKTYHPFEYEKVRTGRIKDPELQRRAKSPRETLLAFVALLENGDGGSVRKLSRVDEADESEEHGPGVCVVSFALLHPYTEKEQTPSSTALFRDGLYLRQESEGTSLYVEGAHGSDARVTSGFFLSLPKPPEPSDLLDSWRDRRNGSPI